MSDKININLILVSKTVSYLKHLFNEKGSWEYGELLSEMNMTDYEFQKGLFDIFEKENCNEVKKRNETSKKRRKTAYQLFATEMRSLLKRENPTLSGKKITAKVNKLWKEDYKDESKREKWILESKIYCL